jgi:hypothetical protein
MLSLIFSQCERLDSLAIPGYFAPPGVFSLSSQWLGWLLYGEDTEQGDGV